MPFTMGSLVHSCKLEPGGNGHTDSSTSPRHCLYYTYPSRGLDPNMFAGQNESRALRNCHFDRRNNKFRPPLAPRMHRNTKSGSKVKVQASSTGSNYSDPTVPTPQTEPNLDAPAPSRHRRLPDQSGPKRNHNKPKQTQIQRIHGDLWMWLQLMWLQFEVVRSPVGVAWG